jgi:hypothetical protein
VQAGHQAAFTGAVAGAASFLGAGLTQGMQLGSFGNVATHVAVEAGKQLAVDGKITSVARLVGAAAAAGAFSSLGADGSVLRSAGDWTGKNRSTFTSGLNLLEGKVRGRGDNAMGWVSLETQRSSTAARSTPTVRQQRAPMRPTDRAHRSTSARPVT